MVDFISSDVELNTEVSWMDVFSVVVGLISTDVVVADDDKPDVAEEISLDVSIIVG